VSDGLRPPVPHSADRRVPTATYRLQIQPEFGFDDAAQAVPHLAGLGVSHVYLSPVLQPAPGSTHGYDVVDHRRLNEEAGGRAAFDRMVDAAHEAGLGVVLDVVPNHMAVPTPEWLNPALWSVLSDGHASPHASWFDVDWPAADDTLLMPILGGSLDDALAAGELALAKDGGPGQDETVVRYYEHELPVRAGTADLPLAELVRRQWWRLEDWRVGAVTLNYRRFFNVSTLIAVRVEEPEVFDASHALLAGLVRDGRVDGLRIDHPDGLADPRGYLRRLAEATDGAWVVVETILEGDEQLPSDWPCAGTTGYDLAWRVHALFVDPRGRDPLTDVLALVSGARLTLDEVVRASKQVVTGEHLVPEVLRLHRRVMDVVASPSSPWTPDPESVRRVLVELLVAVDRYRAYLVPGEDAGADTEHVLGAARDRARAYLASPDHPTLDLVHDLVLGRVDDAVRAEAGAAVDDLVVRFQQTCGPVMAKGIEDTAFYRWHRLVSLNEVGADPDHFAVAPDELMAFVQGTAQAWPVSMTTLTTHDTKRSEDVRARLAVLSERPDEWHAWLRRAQELARPHRSQTLDGATEYLLWQTLVGAWPLTEERLQAYATKAIREAKQHTEWTAVDEPYEQAVAAFVTGVVHSPELVAHVESWVSGAAEATRAVVLGQKLLQLVLPGVPDVYQGTEVVDLTLVDPDNRHPLDVGPLAARLGRLDADGPTPGDVDDEKLLVTSRALRLRRERPEVFVGDGATVTAVPTTSGHAFAVARGDGAGDHVVAVVTRLRSSWVGWDDATVAVPPGRWIDRLTGVEHTSDGYLLLRDVLDAHPVALLVRSVSDHG
jgi:(1->4)-alpha-D-glucan 1-alpha-D-glucosylmutase